MSLEYNKNMIPRAKEMRRPMTKHEALLWYRYLHIYPIRFQRQKTIGSYIVDFIAIGRNWQWSWMARSITMSGRVTMLSEQSF